MRLEGDDDPAAAGDLPRRAQRGGDLGGVMRVVVVHGDPAGAALVLEPPPHPVERRQTLGQAVAVRAHLDGGQRGTQRVEGHVLAGYRQPQHHLVATEPGPYPGPRAGRGEVEQHGVGGSACP